MEDTIDILMKLDVAWAYVLCSATLGFLPCGWLGLSVLGSDLGRLITLDGPPSWVLGRSAATSVCWVVASVAFSPASSGAAFYIYVVLLRCVSHRVFVPLKSSLNWLFSRSLVFVSFGCSLNKVATPSRTSSYFLIVFLVSIVVPRLPRFHSGRAVITRGFA